MRAAELQVRVSLKVFDTENKLADKHKLAALAS